MSTGVALYSLPPPISQPINYFRIHPITDYVVHTFPPVRILLSWQDRVTFCELCLLGIMSVTLQIKLLRIAPLDGPLVKACFFHKLDWTS